MHFVSISLAAHGLAFDSPDPGERDSAIKALGALAFDQRTAWILQHVEGCSVVEVAEVLGRTNKATESLLSRVAN
jgi:DNA-directed RNA polymerase specialized sigma24 family protein